MRFIPDSMEFNHQPRDVATEAPTNYEGLNFHTQALQQSKIHISWDEDEPERAKTLKRKLNSEQLEQLELKEYLASSDSESDEDEDDTEDKSEKKRKKRDMYRALINSGPSDNASDDNYEEKDDDDEAQEMEVTFNTGLDELGKKILEKRSRKDETVWEAHLREKREKKKLRKSWSNDSSDDQSGDDDQKAVEEPDDFVAPAKKHKKSEGRSSKSKKLEGADRVAEATEAELELLVADDTIADTGVKGYNMKRLKVKGKGKDWKKGKGKTIDEEKIPFPSIADDPRFSVIFTSPEFAMDPTDPQFKRSATYARQVAMRKQKRNEGFTESDDFAPPEPPAIAEENVKSDDRSSNKTKYELSTEIKSVKMRCQQIKVPSNERATPTKDDSPKSSKKKGKKICDDDLNSMLKSVKKHSLSSKKGKTYKQL